MACQWTDEQTGGHCPTLAEAMTGTKRKWFTFTNGVHTDSLDPETFNRWYDFLQIYVAKQKPEPNAGGRRRWRRSLPDRDGRPRGDAPRRPDPGRARPRRRRRPRSRPSRRSGSSSTTVPAALRSSRCPASSAPSSASRRRPQSLAPGTSAPAASSPAKPAARRRSVHLGRERAAADRLHRQHRRRDERSLDRLPALRLDAEPGGDRALLRQQAVVGRHDRPRQRRASADGPLRGPQRRPAGDRHRGPPRRQGDVRAGRLAADRTRARSTRRRAASRSRSELAQA